MGKHVRGRTGNGISRALALEIDYDEIAALCENRLNSPIEIHLIVLVRVHIGSGTISKWVGGSEADGIPRGVRAFQIV